ncbi:hypothetical protein CERSUDRAFT_118877 [Gelatoporia subvermispora B]|uniref:DUF6699 domain-containing protein n=1 Tax=Ceriporiopsis subvermispora (strain B) TaxID=914234 RepID=M2R1W5_CERS8|nr:hypothetical protein CERSUDRAFT_118877 [Gelatoporia subvermispora B]
MARRQVRFVLPSGSGSPSTASTSSGRSGGSSIPAFTARSALHKANTFNDIDNFSPASSSALADIGSPFGYPSPKQAPALRYATAPDLHNSSPRLASLPLPHLQDLPQGTVQPINRVLISPLEEGVEWDIRIKEPEELSHAVLSVAATNPDVKPYDKKPWWAEKVLGYVTLGDVFVGLFDHLRVQLSDGALRRMGGREADEAAVTCRKRCAHPDLAGKPKDPRRVDCLGDRYIFDGIEPADDVIPKVIDEPVVVSRLSIAVSRCFICSLPAISGSLLGRFAESRRVEGLYFH